MIYFLLFFDPALQLLHFGFCFLSKCHLFWVHIEHVVNHLKKTGQEVRDFMNICIVFRDVNSDMQWLIFSHMFCTNSIITEFQCSIFHKLLGGLKGSTWNNGWNIRKEHEAKLFWNLCCTWQYRFHFSFHDSFHNSTVKSVISSRELFQNLLAWRYVRNFVRLEEGQGRGKHKLESTALLIGICWLVPLCIGVHVKEDLGGSDEIRTVPIELLSHIVLKRIMKNHSC